MEGQWVYLKGCLMVYWMGSLRGRLLGKGRAGRKGDY